MRPKDRPQSIVITGRVSDMTLADLHCFFESQGEYINSMSELMRIGLESLHEIFIKNGMIKQFHDTTREARSYLMSQEIGRASCRERV